jgi:hypothetical protein
MYEDDRDPNMPIGMDVVARIKCGLAKLDKRILDDKKRFFPTTDNTLSVSIRSKKETKQL